LLLALIPLLSGLLTMTDARAAEPIRYTVRFPDRATHYAEVEALVPTGGAPEVTLFQAVWTPGSYLVREYAQHIEALRASPESDPAIALPIAKTRKNRWTITTKGAPAVRVVYRVYAREMSVQGNYVESGFALLNGAPTFLSLVEPDGNDVRKAKRPHEVRLELPDSWSKSYTGLPNAPGGQPHHYVAPDYDTLVDCPIYAGNPSVYEFTIDGKPHYLVNEGEAGVWDGPRSARDVEAIVKAERDFWGFLPYDKYIFFNLITESGGGLEHCNSTVLMTSRWNTRRRANYLGWLGLVAHEFFHTWNVKRLRPIELGPFDYENEVNTRSLWIAEGLTSYYDRLFVRRAGLCTAAEYLAGDPPAAGEKPRNDIDRLQDVPGRLVQPLESASFDAWIKFYRRDENTNNTAISYYTKGAVVGWLLDARIRNATNDQKSLDDVMRLLYERYSGARGYTPQDFRNTASEVAGTDLSDFFHRALETTDELDYDEALRVFGLRFTPPKKSDTGSGSVVKADPEKAEPTPPGAPVEKPASEPKDRDDDASEGADADKEPEKGWLGVDTKNDAGRLVVSGVKRGTPAFDAGFNVNDEILAIGDVRVRPDGLPRRLEFYAPGETVSVLIARRDLLMRLDAKLGTEPKKRWSIQIDPKADDAARARRTSWLGAEK
jgi:predicted metalloprotease with PDZ domain